MSEHCDDEKIPLQGNECVDVNEEVALEECLEDTKRATPPLSSLKKCLKFSMIPCAFLVQFVILGMLNNVGSTKGFWKDDFNSSEMLIDQAGSANYAVLFISGVCYGPLAEALGCGYVHIIGCIISAISVFLCTFSSKFLYIFLLYGIPHGFGSGLIFFSTIYIQTKYFCDNIAIVAGVIAGGSCFGTFAQSHLLHRLCVDYGWRTVFWGYSLIIALLLFVGIVYNSNDPKAFCAAKKNKVKNADNNENPGFVRQYIAVLKNVKFILLSVSCFIFMLGYLIPTLYMKEFSVSKGLSESVSSTFVGYFSVASFFGRLILGLVANHFASQKILMLSGSFVVMGVTTVLSYYCSTVISFILYSVVCGFFEGGYVTLPVPIISQLFTSEAGCPHPKSADASSTQRMITTAVGFFYLVKSIGLIVGPFIASAVRGYLDGRFYMLFIMAGLTFIVAALFLGCSKFINIRKNKDAPLMGCEA